MAGNTGLNTFVIVSCLPSLIFLQQARTNIGEIDWSLVFSVLLAKVFIFLMVVLITLMVTKPMDIGRAELFAIICTQSNDFAFGYPIFVSLYSNTHPAFPNYLYVLAPLQLIILNPIGLCLMEFSKSRASISHRSGRTNVPIPSLLLPVITRTAASPIVTMPIAGTLWNLIIGPEVPKMLGDFLQSFGNALSATMLFLLGAFIVGKFESIRFSSDLQIPCILTAVKLVVLPIELRFTIERLISGPPTYVSALSEFGFLYGTIPCTPTNLIFQCSTTWQPLYHLQLS